MKNQIKVIRLMDNNDVPGSRGVCHNDLFLFEQIIDKKNLLQSWQEFKVCKRNKADVQIFEHQLVENLLGLHSDLKNGIYRHGDYSSFFIHDPKLRHIHKAAVRDRILHHAIMKQIEPYFERKFIFDSYSSRVGKGTHKAILRLREFAWKLSRNNTKTVWALKCDVRKFFDSIDHEILCRLLEEELNNRPTIALLREVINSYPSRVNSEDSNKDNSRGTPLGNLTSQLFSNIYLNPLDHFVKRLLKEKNYLRYADDFVILSCDCDHLRSLIPKIRSFLSDRLKLELHPHKIIIRKWNQGFDFLGYVAFPHHIVLRTKTRKRMLRNIRRDLKLVEQGLIEKREFKQSVNSYLGLLKHCRNHELSKEIRKILAGSCLKINVPG